MRFTYSSGQRPLDGYTIKRGVGQGGFGEVYFGVSDGGKEVALKLLRGNAAIEQRGVAQCLNLKHPNLVDLYDLRTDAQGDSWVIMEYVSGETLNVVLTRHANGVPIEQVRKWFLELAAAVGYLHDHGIVHRDLKPGNIFLENSRLKVGDYGLCKFISGNDTSRQSQSVGTVHYMAPEIASGNYNKQVDIYAAGIILYEMLTGKVPFEGDSVGEILMKHLTAQPDLTKLPAEFRPIIGRALAKDPTQRFTTMGEMARAVEAVAGGARQERPAPVEKPKERRPEPVLDAIPVEPAEPVLTVLPATSWRGQMAELCGSLVLATLCAAVAATLGTVVKLFPDLPDVASFFFQTVLVCWAVLIPAKVWGGSRGNNWVRRSVMFGVGGVVGLAALWLSGWVPRGVPEGLSLPSGPLPSVIQVVATYVVLFGLQLAMLRWWKIASPRRTHRFSLLPVMLVAVFALLSLLVWSWGLGSDPMLSHEGTKCAVAMMVASVLVQMVSPWDGPTVPVVRKPKAKAKMA